MNCRHCNEPLTRIFIDLGLSPIANAFLSKDELNRDEKKLPLKVMVCDTCKLVQLDEIVDESSIFNSEYVYFSSFSNSWLSHAKQYVEMVTERFSLNSNSLVVEIASNDGYLLQYFQQKSIPVLGIEPTSNTAAVALEKQINTRVAYFNSSLAQELVSEKKADLILGNNVLAHVPDINDFIQGVQILLKPDGICTFEFPHLCSLIDSNQFDTIYHEHYSYFSLYTVNKLFAAASLEIFDVDELDTHGGSLRIYAQHKHEGKQQVSEALFSLLKKEINLGIMTNEYYEGFEQAALKAKDAFSEFLICQKKLGKKIACYGAAAKGNTFLNYCDQATYSAIDFVVDKAPSKQGKYLPGTHIPVVTEEVIKIEKPDFMIILPWNLKNEIINQLSYVSEWNGKFIVAIPTLEVI